MVTRIQQENKRVDIHEGKDMSNPQAESVIRNIIQEICAHCSSKGQTISETLAAFIVKAAVLDPESGLYVDRVLTKDDVETLIENCIKRLMDSSSPSLDTIKMQVHFDMNYSTRDDFLKEHHRVLNSRLQPVVRDITDARARGRDELEALYRKIVSYVLLRSGLGSPSDIGVVREATAALQSVFPQTELGTFMALTREDKEKQLKELSYIVTGIRLFNRDCGKGGEGIDDLPEILKDALKVTNNNLGTELKKTLRTAFHLTGVIMSLLEPLPASPNVPPPFKMKQSLINVRQHEFFLKMLMQDITECTQHVNDLETEFQMKMQQLQETVQAKTAVPTAQVYPLFIALAQLWSGFQDEVVLLSVLSSIITSLSPFTYNATSLTETDEFVALLKDADILTDDERKERLSGSEHRIDSDKHRRAEFVFPDTLRDFDQLPIEFQGFCGYHLTSNDRFLVPAVPSIGLLQYKDKFYAFSSREAADVFAKSPELYISVAVELSSSSTELIQLLNMSAHFSVGTPGRKVSQDDIIKAPVTKCDTGTQTDTHFMDSNIVKSYEWNEWELRRKALKLANLRQRLTHSAQTVLSNFKMDNSTQVYLLKTQHTQTKREDASSVPKPVTYIAGLRGLQSTSPVKVDLTLPVNTHNNITS